MMKLNNSMQGSCYPVTCEVNHFRIFNLTDRGGKTRTQALKFLENTIICHTELRTIDTRPSNIFSVSEEQGIRISIAHSSGIEVPEILYV